MGLEKYAAAFAEAEVDLLALPHLTDADLRELGLPLGPPPQGAGRDRASRPCGSAGSRRSGT